LRTASETGNPEGGNTVGTTITANYKICSFVYYMGISGTLPEIFDNSLIYIPSLTTIVQL